MPKSNKIIDFLFWTFILFLLFSLNYFRGRLDSDNGIFLSGAWSLANNINIYKDFFSFTTPGSYYLLLAVWKIFGISYWAAQTVALIFLFISAIFIFKISAHLNRLSAYLAVILYSLNSIFWPVITSHIFCLPFILAAVNLIIVGLKRNKIKLIYLAALLVGASVLFLQTIGLATIAGIFIFLLWIYISKKNIINLKQLSLFVFFSCLPTFFLFLKWSPLFLFNNLIKFPLYNYSATISVSYILLIINTLFLIIFYFILNKYNKENLIIKLLFIWQLCLFLTAISYPDFTHISLIFAPLLILFSSLSVELFKHRSKLNTKIIINFVVLFSFLLLFLFNFVEMAAFASFDTKKPIIISFLEQNCKDKYLYAGPFLPEFYFENRKLNVGPTHWLLTNHHPVEYFLETAAGLDRLKPDCAIVNYKMVEKFNYNKNNAVDNYLANHYQEIMKFDDTLILKRIDTK